MGAKISKKKVIFVVRRSLTTKITQRKSICCWERQAYELSKIDWGIAPQTNSAPNCGGKLSLFGFLATRYPASPKNLQKPVPLPRRAKARLLMPQRQRQIHRVHRFAKQCKLREVRGGKGERVRRHM